MASFIRTAEQLVRDTFLNVQFETFGDSEQDRAEGDIPVYVVRCGLTGRTETVLSCEKSESKAWLTAAMLI